MDQEKPILAAAIAEEQSLEKELAQIRAELARIEESYQRKQVPLLAKLQAVRAVRAAFGTAPIAGSATNESLFPPTHPTQAQKPRANTMKAAVIEAAQEILSDGVPRRTSELLPEILKRESRITATPNAAQNLSVILSKDPRFVSDRRTGWSLAQKNPQDAATSAGSLPT